MNNQTTNTLHYYSDPGHGWLKVPVDSLHALGVENKITEYSFCFQGFAYLEEDLDMGTYLQALRSTGVEPKIQDISVNGYSVIRNYPRWTPFESTKK